MQEFGSLVLKTFALKMIKTDPNQTEFVDFYLPFNGKLQASNRWVKLAKAMPWEEVEPCYAESFAGTGMGAPAKSGRIAFGALVIKEQLGISDEETVEQIIDCFHDEIKSRMEQAPKKPRTYRKKARKDFLALAKQKSPSKKKLRKAIGKQLRYLKRNFGHITTMIESHEGLLCGLTDYQYKFLLVINTLYEQQHEMYTQGTHTIKDSIVSISQPHVRSIVRGKVGKKTEFGAKISVSSQKEGYVSLDKLSWDAYNEGGDLINQIEGYRKRFGYYPSSVHADQIYRTRENRNYCKEKAIRLSGKPLGRPKKPTDANAQELKAEKVQLYQDEVDRIPIEGKFGTVKRKGSLGRIMTKLCQTSQSIIHVGIVVLNLQTWLRKSSVCIYFAVLELLENLFDELNELKNASIDLKHGWWRAQGARTKNRLIG